MGAGKKGRAKARIIYAARRTRALYGVLAAHRYTTVAGTLTFFLVLAAVPFLFWLILLVGSTGYAEQLASLELFGWAKDLLVYLTVHAQEAEGAAGVFFLVTTLWSVSGFFYHLRRSGEIVYEYREVKHGWKVRLSAVALTFAVLLYFAAAGACMFAGALWASRLPPVLGYPFKYFLLFFLGFLAAWMLNAYVCPYRLRPADTAKGSLLTAALWLLFSAAFSVYLRFSGSEKLYGALSLVVAFLLFLYWMMICFTVGMIYCRVGVAERRLEHKRL